MLRRFTLISSFAVLLGLGLGCGSAPTATLSGTVKFEGEPVKNGTITLTPKDGKGSVSGGPIADGKYSIDGIMPGPKIVTFTADSGEKPPISSADMHKAAFDPKLKGKVPPDGIFRSELIPENAVGNNAEIEVVAGTNAKDFDLKKPTK